jgi:hypothetical protein
MNAEQEDSGTVQVLLERMVHQRLPRALEIKAKVDQGDVLNEFDLAFLEEVFASMNDSRRVLSNHPELHEVAAKIGLLYAEITEKALQNEQQNEQKK